MRPRPRGLLRLFFSRLITALLVAAQALLPAPLVASAAEAVSFDDSKPDLMVVANASYYEVGLRKANGSIAYIKDRKGGGTVSLGSGAETLWKADIPRGPIPAVGGNEYGAGGPGGSFRYVWSADRGELAFSYAARPGVAHGLSAEVVLRASEQPYFDLRLTIRNGGGAVVDRVSFPHDLTFAESDVQEALVPDRPGLILRSGFFKAHGSWSSPSPFTDLVGVRTSGGAIAMYSLRTPRSFWPVLLGLAHRDGPAEHTIGLQHGFPVIVAPGSTWTSPTARLRVSQSFLEAALAVRADNDLGALPSVRTKLGDRYEKVVRAPLFHLTRGFTDRRFSEWPTVLADLPAPALLVVAAYWPGGFHGHYPDVLPPDPEQGTLDELRAAVRAAKARGSLVMPMILPSWWHEESPTMTSLPPPLTPRDIAVIDARGEPARTSWTLGGKRDWGYNVSPYHPFVRQRIDLLFEQLKDVFQADMVYEDVVGAEPLGPDLNPSAPRAGFSTGWYEHVRERRAVGIVSESGTDMLAENAVGFLGSALHSWERMDSDYGKGNWRMYPLAPLLVNDKVLFYQYWATTAVSKAYLGWDLALGSMLNYTLIAKHMIGPCELPAGLRCAPAEPMDGPWPKAIAEFQSRVASRYAGTKMTAYVDVSDGVTRSEFETVTVTRNWSTDRPHASGGFTLPPEGVLVTSASGDLTAGVLSGFNGAPLSPGDHYLIEERSADAIEIRQPIGPDTDLVLKPLAAWKDLGAVRVTAYAGSGDPIADAGATVSGAGIRFTYRSRVDQKVVAFYRAEHGVPATGAAASPAASGSPVAAALPAEPGETTAVDLPSILLAVGSGAAVIVGAWVLLAYRRSRPSG